MNISLSQAYEQLDKFAQATAEKVKIPRDIVKEAQLNQLKKLASQGNETAQMLVNGRSRPRKGKNNTCFFPSFTLKLLT